MIAKKPEHRHQSCAEVIADLKGWAGHDTLSFLEGPGRAPHQAAAQPAVKKP